jgi:hypothetical protein
MLVCMLYSISLLKGLQWLIMMHPDTRCSFFAGQVTSQ